MDGADNVKNLKKKLLFAAGKYSDYSRYSTTLADLENEYDETLEIYDLAIWENQSNGTIRDKAVRMLHVTSELFYDLSYNAEQELYHVMEEIMELGANEQRQIWDLVIEKEQMTKEHFDKMLDGWCDFEYCQNDALNTFLKVLTEYVGKQLSIYPAGESEVN